MTQIKLKTPIVLLARKSYHLSLKASHPRLKNTVHNNYSVQYQLVFRTEGENNKNQIFGHTCTSKSK